jgi:anti-sigma factor RsiW
VTCKEARSVFSGHLDGQLPPDAEDALGEHLVECDECRTALTRYETLLVMLAGAAPPPPPSLEGRHQHATRERRSRSHAVSRWLLPAAAMVAVASATFLAGRGYRASTPAPRGVTFAAVPSCSDPEPWRQILDLREAAAAPSASVTVSLPDRRVVLPRWLQTRGPYDSIVTAATSEGQTTCVPLRAAYGETLTLTLSAAPQRAQAPGTFTVAMDPQRVLYGRVAWVEDGLGWELAGSAEPSELLDLARELEGKVQVH